MKFITLVFRLVKDGLIILSRLLELLGASLDEFNREQEVIKPFKDVKNKAQQIKYIAHMVKIITPNSYINTHLAVEHCVEMSEIVIGMMNATIDHPNQRKEMLLILNSVMQDEIVKKSFLQQKISFENFEKIMASCGMQDASLAEKIRFILSDGVEMEVEKEVLLKVLPETNEALSSLRKFRQTLLKKGWVVY